MALGMRDPVPLQARSVLGKKEQLTIRLRARVFYEQMVNEVQPS